MANCSKPEGCAEGYGLITSGCGILGHPDTTYSEMFGDGQEVTIPHHAYCTNNSIEREGCGLGGYPLTSWVVLYSSGLAIDSPMDRRCSLFDEKKFIIRTDWDTENCKSYVAMLADGSKQEILTRPKCPKPATPIQSNCVGTTQVDLFDNGDLIETPLAPKCQGEKGEEPPNEIKETGCGLMDFPKDSYVTVFWKDKYEVKPKGCTEVKKTFSGCSAGNYLKTWSDGTSESNPDPTCGEEACQPVDS